MPPPPHTHTARGPATALLVREPPGGRKSPGGQLPSAHARPGWPHPSSFPKSPGSCSCLKRTCGGPLGRLFTGHQFSHLCSPQHGPGSLSGRLEVLASQRPLSPLAALG